jgi:hypothetical protein
MSQPTTYIEALDAGMVEARQAEPTRGHMGYSRIGHEDELRLWLEFRWCLPQITEPRTLRIFDMGHSIEDLLAKWTQQAGIKLVTRTDKGEQFRFSRLGDHLAGSMDGAATGLPEDPDTWMVWEAKSSNDGRFKGLIKETENQGRFAAWEDIGEVGLKSWAPEYWAQLQGYMGESGMTRAVIVVLNKNTSEVHVEFVDADPLAFQTLVSKAERIITAVEPPKSIYSSAMDWRCKLTMDDHERAIYWRELLPPTANCRNCRFSQPNLDLTDAQWACAKHNSLIGPVEYQLRGCEKHQFIPALMPALPGLIDDNQAQYKTAEGIEFINGERHFSSKELIELAKDEFAMLGDTFYQQARKELGAKTLKVEKNPLKNMARIDNANKQMQAMTEDDGKEFGDIWGDDIPF